MVSLALSFILLATAFMLHVVVWRVRLPTRPYLWLLVVFLAIGPALVLAVLVTFGSSLPRRPNEWEIAAALLCHGALSLAYIVTYTAIEQDSATLTIALYLARATSNGRSEEDIRALFDDEFVVGARLTSLVDTGYLELRDDRLRITDKGRKVARLYGLVRRVYRLQVGG